MTPFGQTGKRPGSVGERKKAGSSGRTLVSSNWNRVVPMPDSSTAPRRLIRPLPSRSSRCRPALHRSQPATPSRASRIASIPPESLELPIGRSRETSLEASVGDRTGIDPVAVPEIERPVWRVRGTDRQVLESVCDDARVMAKALLSLCSKVDKRKIKSDPPKHRCCGSIRIRPSYDHQLTLPNCGAHACMRQRTSCPIPVSRALHENVAISQHLHSVQLVRDQRQVPSISSSPVLE